MSSSKLRRQVKLDIDAAITANTEPTAPRNGVGLVLKSGRRFRNIMDARGLTPAGKYYYEKTGKQSPKGFHNQDAYRKGRRMLIKTLDGSTRAVATWDNIQNEWRPTQLGKRFYKDAKDKYTVLFPVNIDLTRTNGSIFTRQDYMPSTAVDLGEIEVNRNLTEQQQIAEVKRKVQEWMQRQPSIEGERILIAGYETHRLDTSQEIQYNKLSWNDAATDATAIMHRPLREGQPWQFPFDGVSDDAYAETNGNCVSYQLARHIQIKGKAAFTQEEVAAELLEITQRIYEEDPENDPYNNDCDAPIVGYTAAAIMELARGFNIPVHVLWGPNKIDSFLPERSQYETVALYIWGNHLFTVGDITAKQTIARRKVKFPDAASTTTLAPIFKQSSKAAHFVEWELYTKIKPGHFYSRDMQYTRTNLHKEGLAPTVMLSGLGQIKTLRWNDCIIHALPKDAEVCLKFLDELTKVRSHNVQYRGESMASFSQRIFDEFCKVDLRPPITYAEKQEVRARCGGKCEECGDPLEEIDHTVARSCYGRDELGNYRGLCQLCHKLKTYNDQQKMHVEDNCPYMSRFNEETWEGFVCSRKATQVVCNLHEQLPNTPILHCDIKSCRYNAIVECNTHSIPIFSPMDEFKKPETCKLNDYMWVDVGPVRSLLGSYCYDGPRWYSMAECQFMLEVGVCKWHDFKLAFQATAHRSASDLARKL